MLGDIKSNNIYRPTFCVKSVYTNLEWEGVDLIKEVSATNIKDAKNQTDSIRANSPKALPDNPDMTLLDVILIMKIVDSKGKVRHKQNIEPKYGAYFNPR
jgi:hypothetical protein